MQYIATLGKVCAKKKNENAVKEEESEDEEMIFTSDVEI